MVSTRLVTTRLEDCRRVKQLLCRLLWSYFFPWRGCSVHYWWLWNATVRYKNTNFFITSSTKLSYWIKSRHLWPSIRSCFEPQSHKNTSAWMAYSDHQQFQEICEIYIVLLFLLNCKICFHDFFKRTNLMNSRHNIKKIGN